jgi:Gram-negative bacterial TonB protein C-terminal
MRHDKTKLRGSLMRIGRLSLICGLVSMAAALAVDATKNEAPTSTQTPTSIPESSAGLKSQLEAILRIAKDKKSKQLDNLVNELQIPGDADWFSATFGEELGSSLAATYNDSWKDSGEAVARMFRDEVLAKKFQVIVKEYSASSPVPSDSFIQAILQNSKIALKLYTATVGRDRSIDTLPGIYIYYQGSFRLANWRTFYGLPNVKPVRIRLGTGSALNQLIRQVIPVLPPELRGKKLKGTVLVHIVIDRDGNVIRAEPVSGPPELIKASLDAVRLWLFKPTLLNGDPVEVDTAVTINYSITQ